MFPGFRCAKASLTREIRNSSMTGSMAWRAQNKHFKMSAGPPIGEPPIDFSPAIKGKTLALTCEAAPQYVTCHQEEVYLYSNPNPGQRLQ